MAEPTFTGMPIEILAHTISAYLNTTELGALRLTCRHIERALFNTFAREFFTKRQFMLSTPSLSVLLDISNHAELSQRLEHVIIGLEQYECPDPHRSSPHGSEYDDAATDQQELLYTGRDRQLLAEAFGKLPNLKTVGIRDYSARGRHRDGPGAVWNSYGMVFAAPTPNIFQNFYHPAHPPVARFSAKVFMTLLRALADAKHPVPSVEVIIRRSPGGLDDRAFYVSDYDMPHLKPVLDGLTTLLLTLSGTTYCPPRPGEPEQHQSRKMLTFLENLPNLTHLRLNYMRDDPAISETTKALMTTLAEPNTKLLSGLQTLDLGRIPFAPELLIALCTRLAPSLKYLSLWSVHLQSNDNNKPFPGPREHKDPSNPWRFLLTRISKIANLHLTGMKLGGMKYTYNAYHGPNFAEVGFIKATSKDKEEKDLEEEEKYGRTAPRLDKSHFTGDRESKGTMEIFLPQLIDDLRVTSGIVDPIATGFENTTDEEMNSDEDENDEDDVDDDDDDEAALAH